MTRQSSPTPNELLVEELLAAYADDGLDPHEREVVEAYLADTPAARRELDEMRSVLRDVREAGALDMDMDMDTAREPDWHDMAARIHRACHAAEAEPAVTTDSESAPSAGPDVGQPVGQPIGQTTGQPVGQPVGQTTGQPVGQTIGQTVGQTIGAWLARLARPRYAVAALAMAAAAVFIIALSWRGAAPTPEPGPGLAEEGAGAPVDGSMTTPESVALERLDQALDQVLDEVLGDAETSGQGGLFAFYDELEDLDDDAAELLLEALNPAALEQLSDDELAVALGEDVLPAEILALWAGAGAGAGADADDLEDEALYGTGFGIDVFSQPDYEAWIDEFSDDDIDTLDRLLTEMQAG